MNSKYCIYMIYSLARPPAGLFLSISFSFLISSPFLPTFSLHGNTTKRSFPSQEEPTLLAVLHCQCSPQRSFSCLFCRPVLIHSSEIKLRSSFAPSAPSFFELSSSEVHLTFFCFSCPFCQDSFLAEREELDYVGVQKQQQQQRQQQLSQWEEDSDFDDDDGDGDGDDDDEEEEEWTYHGRGVASRNTRPGDSSDTSSLDSCDSPL